MGGRVGRSLVWGWDWDWDWVVEAMVRGFELGGKAGESGIVVGVGDSG